MVHLEVTFIFVKFEDIKNDPNRLLQGLTKHNLKNFKNFYIENCAMLTKAQVS